MRMDATHALILHRIAREKAKAEAKAKERKALQEAKLREFLWPIWLLYKYNFQNICKSNTEAKPDMKFDGTYNYLCQFIRGYDIDKCKSLFDKYRDIFIQLDPVFVEKQAHCETYLDEQLKEFESAHNPENPLELEISNCMQKYFESLKALLLDGSKTHSPSKQQGKTKKPPVHIMSEEQINKCNAKCALVCADPCRKTNTGSSTSSPP